MQGDERPPPFFFNDTATTEIYTLSLHDALPINQRVERPAFLPMRANSRSLDSVSFAPRTICFARDDRPVFYKCPNHTLLCWFPECKMDAGRIGQHAERAIPRNFCHIFHHACAKRLRLFRGGLNIVNQNVGKPK